LREKAAAERTVFGLGGALRFNQNIHEIQSFGPEIEAQRRRARGSVNLRGAPAYGISPRA
jgi:hypothetical protein